MTSRLLWDKLGIAVSVVCTIHCLLFPAIVATLPLLPVATHIYEWTHPLFILLLLPVVWFAIKRSHYNKKISRVLSLGLVVVILGWFPGHFWLGYVAEASITVVGSLLLIWGHLMNYRHHRVCRDRSHNHHPVDH